ncbi:hypothetical protein SM139_2117, partial [Stenotrophomonas maltophilia]
RCRMSHRCRCRRASCWHGWTRRANRTSRAIPSAKRSGCCRRMPSCPMTRRWPRWRPAHSMPAARSPRRARCCGGSYAAMRRTMVPRPTR